ncbi:CBS domain-containing membrane protein [Geodermatophilus telluris]|uniref:CBS domain-containing membrane protein n=1 Tax=Geodermatophilus telluris TaxID=1190417 RepID=A0A1G6MVB3_9ACTN|nr:HPP family protein [Geodermatophilus telluris]SDC59493.1 CBS domain-containing membrane protein [Geodermatophilus telluris]
MRADRRAWTTGLRPGPVGYRRAEVLRGGFGALAGIALAGVTASAVPGGPAGLPWIVAPMGATAVLLFAAPASPLAQPWPVLAGNTVSTLVGVAAGKLVDDVTAAAAVAVAVAIPLMMVLRCVHPPGGACALFTAVGGAAVHDHGWAFVLWPVGVDTVVLLLVAALVNNLTGRPYPHVPEPPPPPGADAPPTERVGLRTEDVRAAMDRLDRGLDVMPGDVLALVRDAEAHALDRRLGQLRVGAVMARDVRTVQPQETLYRARMLMNQHAVKALPVVTDDRRVVGIVTVYDLFNLDVAALDPVSRVMSSPVSTVGADTPVSELVGLMADRGLRHLPVVDDDGRLAGIVTRAELVAVLHRALVDAQQA